ncbi:hypothetical protein HYDPIDRAFT_23353 [Hydnomerulius pinastri MD-312]|nr:hypothetical protein HYDPIDRAFT_23353 [Hydnomerulius pinastri MD-312]
MSAFGNNQGSATGGNIFGNTGAAGTGTNSGTTANPPSIFGGGSGTSIFGNPPAPGTSIFGKPLTTPTAGTSSAAPSLFGGSAAAPATTGATNPGSSFFATPPATASSQTASLFGNAGTAAGSSTAPKPGLFAPLTSNAPSTSTPTQPTSAFGGQSLFGQKPAESSASKPASSFFATPPATTGTTSGSTLPGGSLFGNLPKPGDAASGTSTPAAGSTPAGGNLFGGSLFGKKPEGTPAASTPTSTSPAPPSAFSLGGTSSTSGTTGGSLFGNLPKLGETASGTATPAAGSTGGGLFSGGLFGQKPGTPAPATSTTSATKDAPPASTTAAPAGSLFGTAPKTDSTEKKDAAPAATSTFSLFGNKDASSEKKDATPVPPSLFGTKPATTSGTSTTAPLGTSSLAPKDGDRPKDAAPLGSVIAVPPPSVLRGKTIEEIVNKWSSDLESHVREFNKFAGEVAVWDRALMENGNNLAAIYSHVLAVEREQSDIEQSLDHIEQQQKDLSSTLDAYERSAEEILGGQGGSLRALDTGPADTERDKNYMLATELHAHLDDLSGSLTQMIDSVNALSLTPAGSAQNGEDPMVQISQILSSHLESLQWIDGAAREVEGKVTEVERRVRDAGMNGALGNSTTKQRGFGLSR